MTELYEANFKLTSKYVHATSRGHEAIQIALGSKGVWSDELETIIIHDVKALAMPLVSETLVCPKCKSTNCRYIVGKVTAHCKDCYTPWAINVL